MHFFLASSNFFIIIFLLLFAPTRVSPNWLNYKSGFILCVFIFETFIMSELLCPFLPMIGLNILLFESAVVAERTSLMLRTVNLFLMFCFWGWYRDKFELLVFSMLHWGSLVVWLLSRYPVVLVLKIKFYFYAPLTTGEG